MALIIIGGDSAGMTAGSLPHGIQCKLPQDDFV